MFSQVYMAGTIIIPILGMEKLRLRAKTLPEVQPRQFDTEQHSHPQGFAIQMHTPTPDNRTSETNRTGETRASHLLISQMKTPVQSFFLLQKTPVQDFVKMKWEVRKLHTVRSAI